ncbi:hypothetical protein HPB51_024822 [Rhipicephalus microplus]|uniref:Rab-GAP TBC domain-containing protein n=1 Tax=Rhipicephalus microplus TaxID=6941 RepID=A0A9J6F8D2_RHIMP|nr:hypothetical protein HPB51_024822 [Rhipicephalus microplus]
MNRAGASSGRERYCLLGSVNLHGRRQGAGSEFQVVGNVVTQHDPPNVKRFIGRTKRAGPLQAGAEEEEEDGQPPVDPLQLLQPPVVDDESSCVSPASSSGGVYSSDLLDLFSLNLHRIDKDVQRCDRNYAYFTTANLEKLRNVMCTYVWEHLDVGYVQGMCDLVAPLLVIFDDEMLTYSCFCELMKRMAANFPHGGAMDHHFANMRSLIQASWLYTRPSAGVSIL